MMTYDEILQSMQRRYRELSGFDADNASDIGIRLKVLAQQAYDIYNRLSELQQQVFPQTSGGRYLEMHAETRGITRKKALPAQGVLRFSREVPAMTDIGIAEGVICATRPDPQVQFHTTQSGVLKAGETWVDIPAEAIDLGAQGNVATGSICLMVTPAPGISSVTNPDVFYGGVDEENDNALRTRLLQSYHNISNGTNGAFYYDLAMSKDGIKSVNILPRARGRGTVDVVISCQSPAGEAEMVAELSEEMEVKKEINVDVRVKAAARQTADVEAEVSIRDGFDPVLVMDNCKKAIEGYVDNLGVGAPLLVTKLGSALFTVDGVYNYRIISPAADVAPLSDHIIDGGSVGVVRMAVG